MLTPSSAAKVAGVAKSTVYSAIKAGRLRAHKLYSGKYAIYPGELRRAFPPAASFAKTAKRNGSSFAVWDVG
jgi:excisionase family DNA binding protein